MKFQTTRRPGKPNEPRVVTLTITAESAADEIKLGQFALANNAIFLGGAKTPKPKEAGK